MSIVRWLRGLIYVALASLINSGFSYLPAVPAIVTTWISRVIMAVAAVFMLKLAPANKRYRKAGILRAAMLACNLITAFLFGSVLLTFAASIFSIIAVYQEYHAHSELIADKDVRLSGKWKNLFVWSIAAALLLTFGASIVAVILMTADMLTSTSPISAIAIGLLHIPERVVEIVYILYINKMISILDETGLERN